MRSYSRSRALSANRSTRDYAAGISVTDPQFCSARGPAPTPLLARHPPVEQPLLTRPKHAGITKFDFSHSAKFGHRGDMFLGEVGGAPPVTGQEMIPAGSVPRVSRRPSAQPRRHSRIMRQTAPVFGNACTIGPAPAGSATLAPTSTT